MNVRRSTPLALLAAAALLACGEASEVPSSTADAAAKAVSSNGVTADLTLQSEWGAGYCANAVLTNGSASPVTSWTVVIELNQSTVSQQPWGATATQSGSQLTTQPVSYTATIAAGTTVGTGLPGPWAIPRRLPVSAWAPRLLLAPERLGEQYMVAEGSMPEEEQAANAPLAVEPDLMAASRVIPRSMRFDDRPFRETAIHTSEFR